jgi:hypothetical protein
MRFRDWIKCVADPEIREGGERSNRESPLTISERKRILIVGILITVFFSLIPMKICQILNDYDKKYYRLNPSPPEKGSADKVYIPKDLEDCFVELKKMLPPKLIEKIESREFSVSEYHLNLALWLRNNWGLWRGSRLKTYFESLGIHHPDDMTSIILQSFNRHLNNENTRLLGQVKMYQKYWEVIPKIFEKRKNEKVFKEDRLEYKEVETDVNSLIEDLSSEMNLNEEKIIEHEPRQ